MEFDFDEFFERLGSFLTHGKGGHPHPTSDDPADYPRSVQIDRPDLVQALESMQVKRQSIDRCFSEARVLCAEFEAMRGKLFMALEDTYPQIDTPHGGGSGYRYWQGHFYFVGFDKSTSAKKGD